jgi:hypothetical protein
VIRDVDGERRTVLLPEVQIALFGKQLEDTIGMAKAETHRVAMERARLNRENYKRWKATRTCPWWKVLITMLLGFYVIVGTPILLVVAIVNIPMTTGPKPPDQIAAIFGLFIVAAGAVGVILLLWGDYAIYDPEKTYPAPPAPLSPTGT